MRTARVERKTKESHVIVELNLDGVEYGLSVPNKLMLKSVSGSMLTTADGLGELKLKMMETKLSSEESK